MRIFKLNNISGYADFLLRERLYEFTKKILLLGRSVNLPLLHFFSSYSDEELIELGKKNSIKLLTALSSNEANSYIDESLNNWKNNENAIISKDEIKAEDITLISFIRRAAFRHFIKEYTSDPNLIIQILDETDTFTIALENILLNSLINQQQGLFKQAQKLAHIGNWQWDLKNNKLTWSEELYNIYEISPSTAIDNTIIQQYNHPDDDELVKKFMESLHKTHDPQNFFYRIILKDGKEKILHVIARAILDEANNAVQFIGSLQDVTKQKQSEKELKISEERYHQMVAEVQDYAILVIDKAGIIQNWNLGAERIKGYKAYEIIGRNFRAFYTPADIKNLKPDSLLEEASLKGRATDEGWRVRKDNSQFWASVVITALHDSDRNIIGFTKVTRDLTERKSNEQQLQDYTNELEQKNGLLIKSNKELESFTYMASHDLQEPLRKIQIFSDQIIEKDLNNLSEAGKDRFERILKASNRMQTLIDDLLAYSRIGTSVKKFERTNLKNIIDEVTDEMKEEIKNKNAVIEVSKLYEVNIIPFQFRQLMHNLIGNSLKFSSPERNCVIKIQSKIINGAEIDLEKIDTQKKYCRISVTDNGIGFEPQYSAAIFEIFQRLHGKEEYKGTGIGLAIVKKIVDNHDGVITATGEFNKGASFDIYLPVF